MIINKVDPIYKEICRMAKMRRSMNLLNKKMEEAILRRPVTPEGNSRLDEATARMADILNASQLEVKGLALLSSLIGMEGKANGDFIRDMAPFTLEYKTSEVENNPYYTNIKFPEVQVGNFKTQYDTLKKGELFMDQEPANKGYQRIDCIGLFDGDVVYPAVYEGDMCWMSITPNEIMTMEYDIEHAEGDVLTLGMGLAYYAYMVHLRDEVTSITIIERQPEVIEIFEKYLLPQFEHPEKVHVIQSDAFEFLENLEDGKYNHCFADIWQNPVDGLEAYLHTKQLGNKFEKTSFAYWVEDSFFGLLQDLVSQLVQIEWLEEDDSEMMQFEGYRVMKELLKDYEINRPTDVQKLFRDEFMQELMKQY